MSLGFLVKKKATCKIYFEHEGVPWARQKRLISRWSQSYLDNQNHHSSRSSTMHYQSQKHDQKIALLQLQCSYYLYSNCGLVRYTLIDHRQQSYWPCYIAPPPFPLFLSSRNQSGQRVHCHLEIHGTRILNSTQVSRAPCGTYRSPVIVNTLPISLYRFFNPLPDSLHIFFFCRTRQDRSPQRQNPRKFMRISQHELMYSMIVPSWGKTIRLIMMLKQNPRWTISIHKEHNWFLKYTI